MTFDIAYTVSRLSRHTHHPSNDHWRLHFYTFPTVLEGFCDANWVLDNDEVSCTSGYVFTLGGGVISWKSTKQTCIAKSIIESEFTALELAGQEAKWLRCLIVDIALWGRPTLPISLHYDSKAAIGVANSSAYNGKRRHMRMRHRLSDS
ncbi:hypothetical protein L6164_031695 [Bauhinia variegata]|uniref:Uncharacterized protein n=1 Tax=Bauhinia variegata TaxID=167791 RepID=A0ACB9LHX8_BAUVA|nr:hypothetical protein L6164_031695 [Bauhinia variegata]